MRHFYKSILTVISLAAASTAAAQTVTVSKSGSPDFSTLQTAIDSFATDPNPSLPNVIQITDSSLYEEVVTVNVPITIEGTGSSKPTVLAQANAVGRAGSAGVVVKLPSTITTDTVTLRNINILPSRNSTPASCAVSVINNNICLFLDKVLISDNNGSDLPISSTGLDPVIAPAGFTNFGDDGVVAGDTEGGEFEGAGVELMLRDTIITQLRPASPAISDGIILNTTGTLNRICRMLDGNILSANNGKGMDIYGDLDISGPARKNIFAYNSSFGMWLHISPNFRNIRNAIIANNQVGIYESTPEGVNATIEDCILTNQGRQQIRVSGLVATPLTIRRTTIANQTGAAYEAIRIDAGPSDLVLENSIIGGNGNASHVNAINNMGTGNVVVNNSAIVFAGSRGLDTPFYNPLKYTGTIVSFQDPQFQNMTDFSQSNFYDVASPFYANIGPGGSALAGGAHYTGTPATIPTSTQTITVGKTGATFTTIQAALDSVTSYDPTKKYVFQILDSAVYDEMITIRYPASITGTGLNRPVLTVQANGNGFDNDGAGATAESIWTGDAGLLIDIPITYTTGTVELKNLIILPSRNGSPVAAGIVNKANNFFLYMQNLLVTGNDGNDAPITIDGKSSVDFNPAHVHFKVSGGHIGSITNSRPEGEGVEVLMRSCIFSNIRAYEGGTWRSGFYMYRTYYITPNAPGAGEPLRPNALRHLTIDESCIFSFNNGSGLRTAASTLINTPTTPIYVVGNTFTGLWLDMQKGFDLVNGAIIAENGSSSVSAPGLNEGVGAAGPRANLQNVIIANNAGYGSYNRLGGSTQSPTRFVNTTLANNGTTFTTLQHLQTSGATGNIVNITAADTIFSGNGSGDLSTNTLALLIGGNINIGSSTALVTNGPFALNASSPITLTHASATQTGTAVTNADPQFVNTTDPFAANFYGVQNTAYATLSSTGGPLSGGGIYAPLSTVMDWAVY